MSSLDDFIEQRRAGNRAVLEQDHLGIRRFFNLDEAAYRDGALPARTKELCGLVASLVLRCDSPRSRNCAAAVESSCRPRQGDGRRGSVGRSRPYHR
ncbi:MAG: alkylhydroperoxidase AhpD family core protein [Acidobacteria bacterium]|nr:alkylhydroperoxidase AhpD family core protein [Acidobacteriota bacterium]